MPQALIPYIASSAFAGSVALATGIAGTITASIIVYGSMLVVGAAITNRMKDKARDTYNKSLRDRNVTFIGNDHPHRWVYGRARIGGTPVLMHSTGALSELLHYVVCFVDHPCDAIEEVWFDDEKVTSSIQYDPAVINVTAERWVKNAGQVMIQEPIIVPESRVAPLSYPPTGIWAVYAKLTPPPTITDPFAYDQWQDMPSAFTEFGGYLSGNNIVFYPSVEVGSEATVIYQYSALETRATIQLRIGAQSFASPGYANLSADTGGLWSTSHVGIDKTDAYFRFQYDSDVFFGGIPNVSIVARGRRVYDPRLDSANGGSGTQRYTDSTTWAWSENAALNTVDWLIHGMKYAPADEIAWADVIAAANVCDQWVRVPDNIGEYRSELGYWAVRRYTCNGIVSRDEDPVDTLRQLLSAMAGAAVFYDGAWHVRAGWYTVPELTLDESDLADGGIEVVPRAPRSELFNAVRGMHFAAPEYTKTDYQPYESAVYAAEDNGEVLYEDISLPFTSNGFVATRISKVTLHQIRQFLTIKSNWKLTGFRMYPGGMVALNLPKFGWVTKAFRVLEADTDVVTGITAATMREETSTSYDWAYNEALGYDAAPNTALPDPRFVAPPVLSFASGYDVVKVLTDGTIIPYLKVTWQAITDAAVLNGGAVEIEWARMGNETWVSSGRLPPDALVYEISPVAGADVYFVRARCVNGLGVYSVWSNYAVGVDPSAQSNENVTMGGGNLAVNAGMLNTPTPWVFQDATPATIYPTNVWQTIAQGELLTWTGPNHAITNHRPAPYNSLLLYSPAGVPSYVHGGGARVFYSPRAIPCKPGDRIELQAMVGSSLAGAMLCAYFATADGAWFVVTEVAGGVSRISGADNLSGYPNTLDTFKHLWGFLTAPANAAQVGVILYPSREVSTSASLVAFSMPYIGYAHPDQKTPTPWSLGETTVGSDGIAEGAATLVAIASSGYGTFPTLTNQGQAVMCSWGPYTNSGTVPVTVIATVSATISAPSGKIRIASSALPVKQSTEPFLSASQTISGSYGSATVIDSAVIAPGQSISVYAIGSSPTWTGSNWAGGYWENAVLRVEVIKR